jgi:flavin reductase (DIM6/NTAB) family NADH-FMN oxidoreductase RutF
LKEVDPSKIHRLFYPDVPAVLCASHLGRVSAMPVVSYASVSETPSLVAVSCDPGAFTYRIISKSRLFSLCILDRSHTPALEFLASHSGRSTMDKLVDAGLSHRRGKRLNVPIIVGSVASLECSLWTKRRFGDHVLVLGKVEAARASEDFKEYWRFHAYRPILYTGWQGRLTTFAS